MEELKVHCSVLFPIYKHASNQQGQRVGTWVSFNLKIRLDLIRFWYRDKLAGEQRVKAEDLRKVHF